MSNRRVSRICDKCGASYQARVDALANGFGRLCSRSCSAKSSEPVRARFLKHAGVFGPDECWNWTGGHGKSETHGYGRFWIHGKLVLAHRVSYSLFVGSIPKGEGHHGTCVLHKCDNHLCVNPSHLFLGTPMDNTLDALSKGRLSHQSRTGCLRGHPYTEENTYLNPHGWRECRICRKANKQIFLARRAAKDGATQTQA